MKKQLLIMANGLSVIGGIGNCLNHMLRYICQEIPEYEVDLILNDTESASSIAKEFGIHLLPIQYCFSNEISTGQLIKMACRGERPDTAIRLALDRQLCKLGYQLPLMNDTASIVKRIGKHYDIAIAYNVVPSYITTFVARYVNADRKIAWSHSDISQDVFSIIGQNTRARIKDIRRYKSIAEQFDAIVTVSEGVKKSIIKEIGVEKSRIQTILNFTDKSEVVRKSRIDNIVQLKKNTDRCVSLLTVGRVSVEKGIDLALEVAKSLHENGCSFIWYFVGENHEKQMTELFLETNKLKDKIHFVGPLDNPYPYFAMCDIYVHTSYIEGYCTTTNEARMLGKPVVTTDVAGAEEQIQNGVNGFVVEKNASKIYQAVKFLIDNEEQRRRFGRYNEELPFDNRESKELLRKLLKC